MKHRLLDFLCCPDCKSQLSASATDEDREEIREGTLTCPQCLAPYPIKCGVPRMADDRGLESFSLEWTRFSRTQLDSVSGTKESLTAFRSKTGFNMGELGGKLVLDAGCGAGRYMEVALNAGAEVIGVDASLAVDAAYVNTVTRPGAHVVQADIHRLPFRSGTFDRVFSIGVLHHTPDTRAAFLRLPRLLKDGGEIAVWVYSADTLPYRVYNAVSDTYRLATTRMSQGGVMRLARVLAHLYFIKKVPVAGMLATLLIPSSGHPDFEWRALDNYDWYSAKWQWKHSYREVEAWFEEAGITEYRRGTVPVSVSGRKPGGRKQ